LGEKHNSNAMRAEVRSLFKRLIFLGHDYPEGYTTVRDKVRAAFLKNRNAPDEKIPALLAQGDFVVREMEALIKLKKYRTLKRSYYGDALEESIVPPTKF
jgi:hypothetical protein